MSDSPNLSTVHRRPRSSSSTPARVAAASPSAAEASGPAHDAELEKLETLYDEYVADRPGTVVVVHGPRADSCDSLMKAWRRRLAQHAEQVFEASCAGGGGNTYQALRDVVSAYYGHLDDMGLVSETAGRIFGELGDALGLAGFANFGRSEISTQPGQVYFYELVGRFFVEASRLKPAVVLLRDLHLADSASLAAIVHLAENSALDPVDVFIPEGVEREGFRGILALTLQTGAQPGGVDLLKALSRGLGHRPHATFVDLRRVDEQTVRGFLGKDEVVSRVLACTGGDVRNLEALLEMLPTDGTGIFARRIAQLSEEAQEILAILAVYGRAMSPDMLVQLAGGTRKYSQAIAELVVGEILMRRVGRGQVDVSFAQAAVRDLVYDGLDPDRRREIHGIIGRMLAERQKLGQSVDLEEIAHHHLASNLREEAIEFALAAADKLHATFAYQRARDLLIQAADLMGEHHSGSSEDGAASSEGVDPASRQELLSRLIDICEALGEHKEALRYCGQLKKLRWHGELASVYRRIGRILLRMGKYDLAVKALAKALYRAGQSEDRLELVRILSHTAEALYGRGEYDRAIEVCDQGLSRAEEQSEASPELDRLVMDLVNTRGKVLLFREDYEQATEYFEQNRQQAQAAGWPEEEVRALLNLGTIAVQRRDYREAEDIFLECLSYSYNTAHPLTRAFCLLNLAVIYQKTLRYDEALDSYLHALAAFKKSGNDLQFAVAAMNLAVLYELLGDLPKAKALTEASMELTQAREMRYFHARNCYVRGMIAIDEREADVAVDFLERALAGFEGAGRTMRSRVALSMTQAYHLQKNRKRRDEWLDKVQLGGDSAEARELRGDFAAALARFKADDGMWEEAEQAARDARAIFLEADLPEKLWYANFELARICRARNKAGEAKRHLGEAVSGVKRLAANVPEALRKQYLASDRRKRLFRLRRSVERGDPFEEREGLYMSSEMGLLSRDRNVVVIGAPLEETVVAWRGRYREIVGEDPRLHHLFRMVDKIAQSDSTVLLTGDSGTGKELFAEAIHRHSVRRDAPLVKVNCAAFVETLLLSELFGHEKGAFTGALRSKRGRFEMAHTGTIFLDEIGDISPNTQVALLRVLQEQTFERVGGGQPVEVDVRVVAATNRNLEEMVREGTFRLDLYYRLKAVVLELPALRERRPDIPLLVRHFCKMFSAHDQHERRFSDEALQLMASYNWPGNIRELENFVRSMLLFVDNHVITLHDIQQFDEFFADGEIIDDPPVFEFARGWWSGNVDEGDDSDIDLDTGELHSPASTPIEKRTAEEGTDSASSSGREASPDQKVAAADATDHKTSGGDTPTESSENPEEAMITMIVEEGLGLQEFKKRLEIECIKRALIETEGNITHAARLLKMKRPRLSQIINANDELGALKDSLS